MDTFYAQQVLMLHSRFGLSENAKAILQAYDDYRFGRLDQVELGRMVRMSPARRMSITSTISKCATIMANEPKDVKHCAKIIHACTEVLKIADEPPSMVNFPFMKLPAEIRQRVYHHYLDRIISTATSCIVSMTPKACSCVGHSPSIYCTFRRIDMGLTTVSRRISDEFLVCFYRRYRVYFSCGCQMLQHLPPNDLLRRSLVKLKVHWNGPVSDEAFALLRRCRALREVVIVLSKATTFHVTQREAEMRRYFNIQTPSRLCDALGLDTLLELRGMEHVEVEHIHQRQCNRRSDQERAGLAEMLCQKLRLPRATEHDQDQESDAE